MPKILIAGGGSGGHVAPAIAIAEALEERSCDVLIAHSTRAIDVKMIVKTPFASTTLPAKPLSFLPQRFIAFCIGFVRSVSETKKLIRTNDIACVVATGGFVAAPALFAARTLRVPTTLLNFDKPAGKANSLARRWADTVLSTVEWNNASAKRVPPPLRLCTIANGDQRTNKLELGLDPNKMTLLVTGASQGAGTINSLIPKLTKVAPQSFMNWQILHLAGPDKSDEVERAYQESSVSHVVLAFTNEMGKVWGAADLAITRGGANTIAEIACNAVPSIVLPYPYHDDDHQRTNAETLASIGGVVIETDHKTLEANLEYVGPTILALLDNHHRRFEMQQALSLEAPINGASVIADLIISSCS